MCRLVAQCSLYGWFLQHILHVHQGHGPTFITGPPTHFLELVRCFAGVLGATTCCAAAGRTAACRRHHNYWSSHSGIICAPSQSMILHTTSRTPRRSGSNQRRAYRRIIGPPWPPLLEATCRYQTATTSMPPFYSSGPALAFHGPVCCTSVYFDAFTAVYAGPGNLLQHRLRSSALL